MGKNKFLIPFLFVLLSAFVSGESADPVIRFYLDLDQSGARASGIAIERGIRLALSEVDYTLDGRRVELVVKDHHGSSRRSLLHLQDFLEDPRALLVYSGLHSPPVLANLDFINENRILLLDPWAAAGPITRTPRDNGENWVFRLSVDDTKAGSMITSYAVDQEGFRRPALLLEDTGWGRSNQNTMIDSLKDRGLEPVDVIWFNWNIGRIGAQEILSDIYAAGADVIFLVANAAEGVTFLKAMADRKPVERLPVRSHWGITGGDIFETLGADLLVNQIDLRFIQTSFSFLDEDLSPFARDVFDRAATLFSDIRTPEDIKAPCGFIHAYDLTRILIQAVSQTGLTGDMAENRTRLRAALENISAPVDGLIKTYSRPFEPFSENRDCAHEALGAEDLRMARFTMDGGILLMGGTP